MSEPFCKRTATLQYSALLRKYSLNARDITSATNAASMYGLLHEHNPVGLYSDETLERELFARFIRTAREPAAPVRSHDWLHVISQTYDQGGHTRLAELFLSEAKRRGETSAVVITRGTSPAFFETCSTYDVPIFHTKGPAAANIESVLQHGMYAGAVLLHIHPDDILAALAARALTQNGRLVYFVNHADHLFSFGSGAASAVLEVSGYGAHLTRSFRAYQAQGYLGIPASKPDALVPSFEAKQSVAPIVLTMGAPYKYEPSERPDFLKLISSLVETTDATVEFVGPSGLEPWWQPLRCKYPDRLVFHGLAPRDRLSHFFSRATVYLDSYPIPGGSAFPEALVGGLPVFGLVGFQSGYSFADGLRYDSWENLATAVAEYLEHRKLPDGQRETRLRLREDVTKGFGDRLSLLARGALPPIPSELLGYAAQSDFHFHERRWEDKARISLPRIPEGGLGFLSRLELLSWVVKYRRTTNFNYRDFVGARYPAILRSLYRHTNRRLVPSDDRRAS